MKSLKIFFLFFLFNSNLDAISIKFLNNYDEILIKKEARLLINLNANEVVHKNQLIFSFDNPQFFVTDFKILIEPENLYIQSFRRNKKVFNRSFIVDLSLEVLDKDIKDEVLFVMQCLVFDQNKEQTQAKVLKLNLNKWHESEIKAEKSLHSKFASNVKNKFNTLFAAKNLLSQSMKFKESEQAFLEKVYSIFRFMPFLFLLIFLSFLLLFIAAKIFRRKHFIVARAFFIKEVLIFIFFASVAGILFYLKGFYLNKYSLLGVAIYFLIVSCYYFASLRKINNAALLTNLFLGLSFGSFVLPLIVRFLILKNL